MIRVLVRNVIFPENVIHVEVSLADSIAAAKQVACKAFGLDPSYSSLVYEGRELCDSWAVRDVGLCEGARLDLIFRPIS